MGPDADRLPGPAGVPASAARAHHLPGSAPSGGTGGPASDISIQAEQILFTKRVVQERIAHHTGRPGETIEADSDRDRWFTAQAAADHGFVDHVVRSAAQVPSEGAAS